MLHSNQNDNSEVKTRSIALARPNIGPTEVEAVLSVLSTAQLSLGPKLGEFEEKFAKVCQTREAVAVSSGTTALHLLMHAMGICDGDEVVTTPFSFVASANCVLMVGAKPVFVDIDPHTWNIDSSHIESAITDRTKAIIPVDVFGQVADMNSIRDTADKHSLRVVEDSCEALGSQYHGRPAGSLGCAGVFGFYPNKQITTGEGGMIVTDDSALATLCRSLRNQGRDGGGGWLAHDRLGFNSRISDINCALGIAQLARLDEIVAHRTRVYELYRDRLAGESRVMLQAVAPGIDVSWFVFVVRLADRYTQGDRDGILRKLQSAGIGCSNYFVPIHLQPFYVEKFGYKPGDFPVCEALSQRSIALPFHHEITEVDVEFICSKLCEML